MKPAIRGDAPGWPRINLGGTWRVCRLCAVALYVSAIGVSEAQNDTGTAAFERLSALVGDWSGSLEWSGARSGRGALNATYYATGNGSAIVENLLMGGVLPTMTSVYHLDGADLRMTHYCAARNQPRLKANKIDNAQGILDFSFVDATNLSSPDAPHVYGLEMRFLDADHIILTFLYEAGGKQSKERIDLKRVPAKSAVQR